MLILARIVYGLAIFWSLLQLIAESGLLPPADAQLGNSRGLVAAPTSIELVRRNYADCARMQALVARYDAGEPVLAVGLLEMAARCEGRSLQP